MEPIVVNSELSLKEYYRFNLYILLKRIKWYGIMAVAILLVLYYTDYLETDRGSNTLLWLGLYFLFLFIMLPLINYLAARRQFKKIKAMGEPKVYTFTEKGIHAKGVTTELSMDWSNINKAIIRKKDVLLGMYSNRSYFILKNTDFTNDHDLQSLKDLIKAQGIKHNMKG